MRPARPRSSKPKAKGTGFRIVGVEHIGTTVVDVFRHISPQPEEPGAAASTPQIQAAPEASQAAPDASLAEVPEAQAADSAVEDQAAGASSQGEDSAAEAERLLEAALAMAGHGFRVIPIWPRQKEKPPAGWQTMATANPETVRRWWSGKYRGYNIAYLTGEDSGAEGWIENGWVVLDIDPRNDGIQGLEVLQEKHGPLPDTWVVHSGDRTGGHQGHHRIYRLPDPAPTLPQYCVNLHGAGVSLISGRKDHGHYCLGPGAVHPSGRIYAWSPTHNPLTMPCSEAPAWLLALRQEPSTPATQTHTRASERGGHIHKDGSRKGVTPGGGVIAETKISRDRGDGGTAGSADAGYQPDASLKDPLPPNQVPGHLSEGSTERTGAAVGALLRDPANLRRISAFLGISAKTGEDDAQGRPMRCPCGSHAHGDTSASGTWLEHATSRDRLQANHPEFYARWIESQAPEATGLYCHATNRLFGVTSYFYMMHGNNADDLEPSEEASHRPSLLAWGGRLLIAAGIKKVSGIEAQMPVLPSDASEDVRALWTTIKEIVLARSLSRRSWRSELPLTWRFLQNWAGRAYHWTEHRIKKAFGWLLSKGYLSRVGVHDGIHLWAIGSKRLRTARADKPVGPGVVLGTHADEAASTPLEPAPLRRASQPAPGNEACPWGQDSDHDPDHCGWCGLNAQFVAAAEAPHDPG